jgi:hypothetical protein
MNDPIEERLRATFRQAAQQTTTSHDIGLPPPSPRPTRGRRLVVTAALTALALVGVGVLVASRDNGPETVQAAAGEDAQAPDTTLPNPRNFLGMLCANASSESSQPGQGSRRDEMRAAIAEVCDKGVTSFDGLLANDCFDTGAIRDLLAPILSDLGPAIEQLQAIADEFEPRFRAVADDPATKAKIEAGLAPLRERLEGLADPANRPDLSDPAARQQLYDEIKADLEPLTSDAELRAQLEPIINDLKQRLEGLAASPEVQALKDKLEGLAQSDEAKSLADKLADCFPR